MGRPEGGGGCQQVITRQMVQWLLGVTCLGGGWRPVFFLHDDMNVIEKLK